ncbi:U4/U6-U5 snRNP complex subunit prp31 [Sorochytrium milnesiophthora]
MSVADDLMADLLELDDVSATEAPVESSSSPSSSSAVKVDSLAPSNGRHGKRKDTAESDEDDVDDADMDEDLERDAAIEQLVKSGRDITALAKVLHSQVFKDLLHKVEAFTDIDRDTTAAQSTLQGMASRGTLEEDPEYKLIVAANNIVPDLETDMAIVHKYISDHYNARFPELLGLVKNPVDYAKIVQALGNHLDTSAVDLRALLLPSVAVMVNVTASTTAGKPISEQELETAMEGCRMMLSLEAARNKIMTYIESRMTLISPNLSALAGTSVAAKLLGAAGGLSALCRIPASNILVLGQSKKVAMGLSNIGIGRHRGLVWESDFVRATPSEYKRKAARLISAKVCLCARTDLAHAQRDGAYGRTIRAEIDTKIAKAMAPPPNKGVKALPVPDEPIKKRRGGRRARKIKEMYAVSDAQKAANRVAFGVEEQEIESFGDVRGLGMLTSSTGKVRAITANAKQKGGMTTSATPYSGLATSVPGMPISSSSAASGGAASGTATSLSFTPVQGLEFVDPSAQAQRVKDANDRWFNKSLGFASVLPGEK